MKFARSICFKRLFCIILLCAAVITLYQIFFNLKTQTISGFLTPEISDLSIEMYIVKSSKTKLQREKLPNLEDLEWPPKIDALTPAPMNGNHLKHFEPKYSIGQRQTTENLFQVFCEVMEQNDWSDRWFVYGGTLLGSIRHHDQIPWDDDFDIIIDEKLRRNINEKFSNLGSSIKIVKSGHRDKICGNFIEPFNNPKDLDGSRKTNSYSWGWPFLDLTYYHENETHVNEVALSYNRLFIYKKKDIFPLLFRPLGGMWVPSPYNSLVYIDETYHTRTDCASGGYSHIIEKKVNSKIVKCTELQNQFAFVNRIPCCFGAKIENEHLELVIEQLVWKSNFTGETVMHEVFVVMPKVKTIA